MGLIAGIRRHAAVAVLLVTAGLGLAGAVFLYVALRPCQVVIEPGTIISYVVRMESQRLEDGHPVTEPRVRTQEILLVGVGPDNQVVMLNEGRPGQRDEAALLRMAPDGSVRLFDAADRPIDGGRTIWFFDFNLLRLPRSLTDVGRVEVEYGILPPGRRQVSCQVRCLDTGLMPRFRLRPVGNIEWVDHHHGSRFVQIADLDVRYRFDRRLRIIDRADISFRLSREAEEGALSHQVHMSLRLAEHHQVADDQVARLADLAVTGVRTQHLLEDGRRDAVAPHLERLAQASVDHPRLRRFLDALIQDAGGRSTHASSGHVVRVAAVGVARMEDAQRVAAGLLADGYPAYIMRHGDLVTIFVGPYEVRQPEVLEELTRRFPRAGPYWIRADDDRAP